MRKAPLTDITHRPLTGRRSNNTPSQAVASLTCSAGSGEENNPTRGLLEIFAAVQTGSISRKRSLKLTSEECDHHPSFPIFSPALNSKREIQQLSSTQVATYNSANQAEGPIKSRFSLSYNSKQPLNLISTLSQERLYGRQRNKPSYVSTRFHMLDYISRPSDTYTFISQDSTTLVPPFSCAYNNVANEARNLAVGDEDGTIHIVDTRRDDAHPEGTIRIQAHQNAIFDLCWTRDDSKIITASGDQTAKLYDVETKACLGTFSGHAGSIKSTSMKFNDDKIFATAARDGAIMIWDVRCSSTTTPHGDILYRPADRLLNVHANSARSIPPKKSKHGSDGPNTASAVQYMMHNENIIASTGTLDGSVKYWDVRKHGTYFRHDFPTPLAASTYTPLTKRAHGMTSMALSPDGSALYAVSSDNHIYMFNTTVLGGPVEQFGGSDFMCSSYYIKISVSPDGNYVAAGSCKDLYVWEVKRPDKKPLIFHGHEREVTGVDWAKDIGDGTQLSGCSDDATVRIWRPNKPLVEECQENESLKNMHGMVTE
ncbi:WD40-repeat-containing domain protein [Lobosporangium transversale]|uniref:WD40-repeat-containing domain protein n=1 Tax=Lobosporangium transversale TaxID=64571 RepID=A0A1Y2GZA1_9FUNG|nr:WD40-repeat-containing domain protein [Lobosporangium transversale]ORZ27124.1 WD40-repeat-containing domain protein [Lobosporangium transversale]|eukprot:XP_021884871.1 WD40-repeat-containing domain protein [Lobosporangium transversale]